MHKIFKSPLYLGIIWMGIISTGYLLRGYVGPSGKGPSIQYWPTWAWILMILPGLLLVIGSKYPNSFLGKIGIIIFKIWTWVQDKNKK